MNNISVIGVGRLGLGLALLIEKAGYNVCGVDIFPDYVKSLNDKTYKTKEPEYENLLKNSKNFHATTNLKEGLDFSDTIFIIVQTPNGGGDKFYDHSILSNLLVKINKHKVKNKDIIIGCTVMPKYITEVGKVLIENCENTTLNYNPEFIAQGEIIKGFLNPDIILIGAENESLGEKLEKIYSKFVLTSPRYCVLTPLEAEIVKITINGFITTKLSFANMMSDVCDNCGADKYKVLNSIGGDSRIGNKYFRPGYSFGGPCFPRDTIALKQFVDKMEINSDLLTATTKYNKEHIKFQTNQILRENPDQEVFEFTGVCYKEDSKIPIIEESAKLKIAENLVKKGKNVIIKDEIQLINECKKEYGNLFNYEIVNNSETKTHDKKDENNIIYAYSHKNNYIKYKTEYDKNIQNTIDGGLFINGPAVKILEDKLEKYVDTKNAITVSCGTNALLVALMALNVKPGDEIITTPLTWIATSEVICVLGATPVFVDINRETYNIDENKVKEAITEKTKGILAVSLYGQMCNIKELMKTAKEHDLWVVEDGAQSFGSKRDNKLSCSLATISCTSFYPTKPLGGWGNGGACLQMMMI